MAGPSFILLHVFGNVRDELDRSDRGKKTYSGWLREFVTDTPQRLTEIARLLDLLSEQGWKMVGSPYDCDVMLERAQAREIAEQDLRRAEVWDRLAKVASPDDDGTSSGPSTPRAGLRRRAAADE